MVTWVVVDRHERRLAVDEVAGEDSKWAGRSRPPGPRPPCSGPRPGMLRLRWLDGPAAVSSAGAPASARSRCRRAVEREREARRRAAKANAVAGADRRVINGRDWGRLGTARWASPSHCYRRFPRQSRPTSAAVARFRVMSALSLCKNCAPDPMTNPARPWTRFYPPSTAHDLGPLKWPHMPAAIREAAATYGPQTAFTLALPNGSQGGITYAEVDRLSDQFAVYLREVAGFKAGDRVAIQMPNCLAYPDRRVRDAQGRLDHGEHQPALHAGGDGAPVLRQRRRRPDRRSTCSRPRSPRCCRRPRSRP